jgi:two-component sensor histidine kinase
LVNELVTNAIKHAFKDRKSGEVSVTFAEVENGFRLTVADNGSGFEVEAARKGSGSRIVEALAQQLKGELEVSPTNGTTWSILLHPSIRRDASAPLKPSSGDLSPAAG